MGFNVSSGWAMVQLCRRSGRQARPSSQPRNPGRRPSKRRLTCPWTDYQRFAGIVLVAIREEIMPDESISQDSWKRMIREAAEHGAQERVRIKKVIEDVANRPPPMDTTDELHAALTRAFAALHAIRRLPCQTDPEGTARFEADYGRRRPCGSAECASCLAIRALIVEGQYPF